MVPAKNINQSLLNMTKVEVDKILNTFYTKDYTHYYAYQKESWKKNIWLVISELDEFKFVREIINTEIKKIDIEYECSSFITFLIYQRGDYFSPHVDKGDYDKKNKTVLTGGYVLNNTYMGGDFFIGETKIATPIGELVTFERTQVHKVSEVTNGVRYSLHFAINKIGKPNLI